MWQRLKNAWTAFQVSPNISLTDLDRLIELGDLGERSSSGVRVSERAGSRVSTAYACIQILSGDKAALPLKLYEKMANGGRAEVNEHPVSHWAKQPNPAMTAMQFHFGAWAAVHSTGNDYSHITRNTLDEIATWPLPSQKMEVIVLPDGRRRYKLHRANGSPKFFEQEEILHNYYFTWDGWRGVSPIRWNLDAFGRAIALQEYSAAAYDSPIPKAILTHPTGFKDEADEKNFVRRWRKKFAGKKGLKQVAVLPEGMAFNQLVKISNEDAQLIESMKLSKEELTMLYNVPMHRANALDRSTFSNIEHQDLEYVKYSLLPRLTAREQVLERALLTREERERFFIRHNVEGLLRGDFKTRMEGHALAAGNAVRTPNENRALENLPPKPGGDELLTPLNWGLLEDIRKRAKDEPFSEDDED